VVQVGQRVAGVSEIQIKLIGQDFLTASANQQANQRTDLFCAGYRGAPN
jgi:hypothetical protein